MDRDNREYLPAAAAMQRLVEDMERVRCEFAQTRDADLLEACTFELKALEARCRYLLRMTRASHEQPGVNGQPWVNGQPGVNGRSGAKGQPGAADGALSGTVPPCDEAYGAPGAEHAPERVQESPQTPGRGLWARLRTSGTDRRRGPPRGPHGH